MTSIKHLTLLLFLLCLGLFTIAEGTNTPISLRQNLKNAHPGDYLVMARNKIFSVLIIRSIDANEISIEEITVPNSFVKEPFSWRKWVQEGASGNTCRMIYPIQLSTGMIASAYSINKGEWVTIPKEQNFLSTLLSLQFTSIPDQERKRVGPPPVSDTPDKRPIWQPKLTIDGKTVPGVTFDAWKARWPKDGGELSGKIIEVFLPRDSDKYPAYFPYWLQVSGLVGKASLRIVDAGSGLFVQ